jgi:hypothetical protein
MRCNRLRLFEIAALADENGGSAGDVDTHWCGRARCRCMARGSRLPLDCCQESTRVCVLAGVPPDRPREAMVASRTERGTHGGHVRPGRRFGCRQGDVDGVRPHARPARWPAQRDAHVQDDNWVVAGDAGLAGRGRGKDRGDGVDLDVLEAAVLLPGRSHGGVAAQRRPHEGGARPQERRPGRGVDRPTAGARAVGAVVRATTRDPPVADADPVSDAADGGPAP